MVKIPFNVPFLSREREREELELELELLEDPLEDEEEDPEDLLELLELSRLLRSRSDRPRSRSRLDDL